MTEHGASVQVRDVEKKFGSFVALGGINLDVIPGEFLSLLGPSGSGKTTLLNLIAGFRKPSAGSISIDGQPVADLRPNKRDIGVVFQHYALFPHMTAFENVAFPLKRRRTARAEIKTRVHEALELVGLAEYGNRRPNELSGGQQQRVAFARALVFEPRILLMDEPLGALDKKLRDRLQLEIMRIHDEVGITFIYVTHDQEEALLMSDRVAVFSQGLISQIGSPRTLYDRPETLFVAEFVGESNFFSGQLETGGNGTTLNYCGQSLRCPDAPGPEEKDSTILVRPERLVVTAAREADAVPSGYSPLAGRVQQLLYLGSHRKIEVVLAVSGVVMTCRESARVPSTLQPGDDVHVWWEPDDGVLLRGHPALDEAHVAT